jgi:hypothetical protein
MASAGLPSGEPMTSKQRDVELFDIETTHTRTEIHAWSGTPPLFVYDCSADGRVVTARTDAEAVNTPPAWRRNLPALKRPRGRPQSPPPPSPLVVMQKQAARGAQTRRQMLDDLRQPAAKQAVLKFRERPQRAVEPLLAIRATVLLTAHSAAAGRRAGGLRAPCVPSGSTRRAPATHTRHQALSHSTSPPPPSGSSHSTRSRAPTQLGTFASSEANRRQNLAAAHTTTNRTSQQQNVRL